MTGVVGSAPVQGWPSGVHRQIAHQLARQALIAVSSPPAAVATRFWERVDRSQGVASCWPWIGARRGGYGFCRIPDWGTSIGAHRVALWLARGVLGDAAQGEITRHLCHNKACCNPTHLLIGCAGENKWDDWLSALGIDLVAVRAEVERDFARELEEALIAERLAASRRAARRAAA